MMAYRPSVQRVGRRLLSSTPKRLPPHLRCFQAPALKNTGAGEQVFVFLEKTMTAATFNETTSQDIESEKPQNRLAGRLTVNLPLPVLEDLKQLAQTECVSVTEIIRRAISAEKFIRSQSAQGNRIYILEKGQTKPTKVLVFQ
jgi:Ribbon-helix-helix protein, copG family